MKDRHYSKRQKSNSQICIFCKMGGELQEVSTFDVDRHIRFMAEELEDSTLLARIAAGDMIAIEAKYHNGCLLQLKNRYRAPQRDKVTKENTTDENMNESRAYVELVSYMEQSTENGTLLFKLSDL